MILMLLMKFESQLFFAEKIAVGVICNYGNFDEFFFL